MKRKRFLAVACAAAMIASMTTGLAVNVSAADEKSDFAGEELSILVSAGWMDNRYDETIKRFEDTYDVTVDLQTIPADQYSDLLQSKLATDSCADIFWIQSNPFAIESTIVDPEKYCIDFTGASWENVMPETRKESCVYNDKLYGLQIWNASPEYVMVYNKTLFEENGWEVPTTYDELKELCGKIQDAGITPWFMPGADGWQQRMRRSRAHFTAAGLCRGRRRRAAGRPAGCRSGGGPKGGGSPWHRVHRAERRSTGRAGRRRSGRRRHAAVCRPADGCRQAWDAICGNRSPCPGGDRRRRRAHCLPARRHRQR